MYKKLLWKNISFSFLLKRERLLKFHFTVYLQIEAILEISQYVFAHTQTHLQQKFKGLSSTNNPALRGLQSGVDLGRGVVGMPPKICKAWVVFNLFK